LRFISKHPGYRIVCKHQDIEILASGLPRVLRDGYTAEFKVSDVTDWERDAARGAFTFVGTTTTLGGNPIDPVTTRISGFDTNRIADTTLRAEVEKALQVNTAFGHDYILVEKPTLPAPWPKYDSEKVAAIAGKVADSGYDPQDVIAYERANKNRPSVIEALEALLVKEPEEELVTA